MAKNIEEYVINKVIEYMEESKKKDIEIKKMKKLLRDNNICFECVCSKCNKKIDPSNDDHSHNTHEQFPTLCYKCFFSVL